LVEALVKRRLPVDTEVSFLPAASYDRLFSTWAWDETHYDSDRCLAQLGQNGGGDQGNML